MSLGPGHQLAHYEIVEPIGKGGMGEVYRARDTKLGRDVAIKVLPDGFAQDEERLRRFQREAKVLASLNHPNIAAIYGLEQSGGTHYLVLELVPGETLAERIARGPIPVEEALEIAIKIADAVEEAHERGIVHRDLKPANVKLTEEGKVKVLDFGLAKAFVEDNPESEAATSMSPTLTKDATRIGVILGTAAYMSPEQAKGRHVDKRTDIFAFGAVLYEMLAATKAFGGEDVSDVLASVIKLEPDWSALPPGLDARIRDLVRRCLVKDPKKRRRDIGDVRNELEAVRATPDVAAASPLAASAPSRRRERVLWGVAVLVACALVWNLKPSAPAPTSITRLSVTLPSEFAFRTGGAPAHSLVISPDGRRIVYVGRAANDSGGRLYMRSLDSRKVEPIAGTDGAKQPFFSPGGNWVAFFTIAGELKKVRLDGGTSVTLAEGVANSEFSFGAWRDDGTIVFTSPGASLFEVSSEGGVASPLSMASSSSESSAMFPVVDENTGDVFFTAFESSPGDARIERVDGATRVRQTILDDALFIDLTASGHVLFVRNAVLMAGAYDAATRSVERAVPLPESIARDDAGFPQLAVSSAGTLAFVPALEDIPESTLGWVTRDGEFSALGSLPEGAKVMSMQLSPDGRAALVSVLSRAENPALLFDLSRSAATRLPVGGEVLFTATWHPDGRRITLGGDSLRVYDLGSGDVRVLVEDLRFARSGTWTRDGATVAYVSFEPDPNIYVLRADDETPRPVIATSANEHSPVISPDGRWIAYVSDESGTNQVWVARFPAGDLRRQVSVREGWMPIWDRSGGELYFAEQSADTDGHYNLHSVSITSGETPEIGTSRKLFEFGGYDASGGFAAGGINGATYDVSPDGSRFLVVREPAMPPATEIVIVENWLEELERLVPTNE